MAESSKHWDNPDFRDAARFLPPGETACSQLHAALPRSLFAL